MSDRWAVHHGDCREVMRTLDPESIDSIVTDPPYGLSFMGKGWDHGVPGVEFWTEALRVVKPGAHLLAFGGTRTYHRLAELPMPRAARLGRVARWLGQKCLPHTASRSQQRGNPSPHREFTGGAVRRGEATEVAGRDQARQHAQNLCDQAGPIHGVGLGGGGVGTTGDGGPIVTNA